VKVWAFNANGSRVNIHVRVMKIYVATMERLKKKERHDGTYFQLKLVEKLSWVPIISFLKFSSPIRNLMPYYAKISCSHPLIAWLYQ
jgi:hypothetical protein